MSEATTESEVAGLRARVEQLEALVLMLVRGKAHDLSWLPHFHPEQFKGAKGDAARLAEYGAAWRATRGSGG